MADSPLEKPAPTLETIERSGDDSPSFLTAPPLPESTRAPSESARPITAAP